MVEVGLVLLLVGLAMAFVGSYVWMSRQKATPEVTHTTGRCADKALAGVALSHKVPSDQLASWVPKGIDEINRCNDIHDNSIFFSPHTSGIRLVELKTTPEVIVRQQQSLTKRFIQRVSGICQHNEARQRQGQFGFISEDKFQFWPYGTHFELRVAEVNPLPIENFQALGGLLGGVSRLFGDSPSAMAIPNQDASKHRYEHGGSSLGNRTPLDCSPLNRAWILVRWIITGVGIGICGTWLALERRRWLIGAALLVIAGLCGGAGMWSVLSC